MVDFNSNEPPIPSIDEADRQLPLPLDASSPAAQPQARLPEPPLQNANQRLRSFLWELLQTVVLVAALYFAIDFVTARIRVESISMLPTLQESDWVMVNRLAYRYGELQRGDVIIFDPPLASTRPYIKRMIGLPGDVVRIVGGEVYVNDTLLQESYISAPPSYNGIWNVPADNVFVLGDNRNASSDSHLWGTVPVKNILGKALFIYWPATHWSKIDHSTAAAAQP